MAPRWKRRAAEAEALSEPMSKTVLQLKSSLIDSNTQGLLSGHSVLLAANPEQTELLSKTCFGQPIITTEKDNQWFELCLEESFYLSTVMKCIEVIGEDKCIKTDKELWHYAMSLKPNFPILFKAYSHLRSKNWVVVKAGSESRYGVDFVVYRHHPSRVHSEFAVLVLSGEDESKNARLRVWSDAYCSLRVCGSVAKTLLALYVSENGEDNGCPLCLKRFVVEERIITRWNPEQSRENQTIKSEPCKNMENRN